MVKMITSKSVFILWDSFASWGTCCFNVLGRLKILRIRKHLIVHEKNWFYKFQVIWADETTTKSEWSTWIFCDVRLSTHFRSHFIILRIVPLWHACLKVKIICSNPSLTLNLNFHPVLLEICMVHLLWTPKIITVHEEQCYFLQSHWYNNHLLFFPLQICGLNIIKFL